MFAGFLAWSFVIKPQLVHGFKIDPLRNRNPSCQQGGYGYHDRRGNGRAPAKERPTWENKRRHRLGSLGDNMSTEHPHLSKRGMFRPNPRPPAKGGIEAISKTSTSQTLPTIRIELMTLSYHVIDHLKTTKVRVTRSTTEPSGLVRWLILLCHCRAPYLWTIRLPELRRAPPGRGGHAQETKSPKKKRNKYIYICASPSRIDRHCPLSESN